MKKFLEYMWLELKIQFRVPISVFFTIVFPCMLLSVFVLTSNNDVVLKNLHMVDVYLPVMMLLSLFSNGITGFSVIVAGNRSEKVWQMYRLRGFKLYQIILSQIFVSTLFSLISGVVLVMYAHFLYNAHIPDFTSLLVFLLNWIIVAVAIFLIGFLIGVFCKNEKVAQAVSTPIMFILMFLSGIMVKRTVFPENFQKIVELLPTTQSNNILINSWTKIPIDNINWTVIVVWLLFSFTIIIMKLYNDDFKRL